MTRYQVTALFGNVFEVIGADEVEYTEALRLFDRTRNSGRKVRIHQIIGSGSRLINEAN